MEILCVPATDRSIHPDDRVPASNSWRRLREDLWSRLNRVRRFVFCRMGLGRLFAGKIAIRPGSSGRMNSQSHVAACIARRFAPNHAKRLGRQSATSRRSTAVSVGHSNVGFAPVTGHSIRIVRVKDASSGQADVRVLALICSFIAGSRPHEDACATDLKGGVRVDRHRKS